MYPMLRSTRALRSCFHRALAPAALLALVTMAGAQQPATPPASPTYNIELIVFRAAAGPGSSEDWSSPGVRAVRGGDGENTSGAAQVGRFVGSLPATQLQLNDLKTRLSSGGAYIPVAHVAWSQTASTWGSRAGFTLQKLGVSVPGLSGLVSLERGSFLHLGVQLKYATGPGGPTYDLTETRRVKFYERNYFDHPAFGVIAVVTPTQGARPAGR